MDCRNGLLPLFRNGSRRGPSFTRHTSHFETGTAREDERERENGNGRERLFERLRIIGSTRLGRASMKPLFASSTERTWPAADQHCTDGRDENPSYQQRRQKNRIDCNTVILEGLHSQAPSPREGRQREIVSQGPALR